MAAIIIVDDHPLVRTAIRLLLEKHNHIILAEAGEGKCLIELLNAHQPDVIILDIDLPGMDGLGVISELRSKAIPIPIIVMSGKNMEYYSSESMKAGANGFVSKKSNLGDVLQAIKGVIAGYGYFPIKMRKIAANANTTHYLNKLSLLSRRELEVLHLLAEGHDGIGISTALNISNKTVSTFKSRLMDKLGLQHQHELMKFIISNQMTL